MSSRESFAIFILRVCRWFVRQNEKVMVDFGDAARRSLKLVPLALSKRPCSLLRRTIVGVCTSKHLAMILLRTSSYVVE